MSIRKHVEQALACLVDQPMWAAGLAGPIAWFQFGSRRVVPNPRTGGTKEVGEYALHVDCPWRWVEAWGDSRADHHAEHGGLAHLGHPPPICNGASATDRGAIELSFNDGSRLLVEPDLEEDTEEWWRLLQPSVDAPHFVVGSSGIERDA